MHSDTWSLDPTLPALSALPAAGARLTPELLSVAAGARRRAARDGDRQIDTAHLLHSLLETDPRARALCDGGTGRSVRVLGYLAQRSIGYGLRWRHAVEDGPPSRGDDPVAGWSPCAAAAMGAAVRRASARGAYRTGRTCWPRWPGNRTAGRRRC